MAVQIVKPVDTGFPMNPLTVKAGAENENDFTWVSLLCCQYSTSLYHSVPTDTDIDADWEEDIEV